MKSYLMLCKKKVKVDKQEFDVTFGYRQVLNPETNEFEDVKSKMTIDGVEVERPRSVKVALAKDLRKKLDEENKYPYRLTLDDELKDSRGEDSYYVTINKDKEGKERLDKNGKHHAILVIRAVADYEVVPPKSYTLDDIDNI